MSSELQLQDALTFVAPLTASATTCLVMHWFPGASHQPPVVRYAMGTSVTVGIPAATMVLTWALGLAYGHLFWAALLLTNAMVSGASVAGAYWIDAQRPVTVDEVRHAARQQ